MANTRRRAPARRRSARGRSRRTRRTRGIPSLGALLPRALPRLPALDQRQRDVLGLALIAAGVFMGFVLYASGGTRAAAGGAGHGLALALGWVLGKARTLAPVALVLGG